MPQYSVRREGAVVIVETTGKDSLASLSGVICANPDAPSGERVYRKEFRQKRIYLADEYDRAVATELGGRYPIIIAMNGYSSLSVEQCQAWGVKPGAYEKACEVLLTQIDGHVRAAFPDADVCYVHGAADMGVDKVIAATAKKLRRRQLGFNCPEYMFYVPDDDVPVYVAESVEAYADSFVRTSDVLIAANGRLQAFRMDISAVFMHDKFLLPVNVLRFISTTGGPPAKRADGGIEDAVAHFEQRFYAIGTQYFGLKGHDAWASVVAEAQDVVAHICRRILAPEVGLEIHR
jgi:hypothetical protein